ncbi:MAG: glycosyltransferase [Paracoccaceae bacterium]|nr:glycosyltransferase [Paracoccaceae bacterium]
MLFRSRKDRFVASLIEQADQARDHKDWEKAARRYSEALGLDPSKAGIWVQMGHALKESGSLWRAEEAYSRAIRLEPDRTDNFLQLGHALKLRGDAHGALMSYLEAEKLDAGNIDVQREVQAMRRMVATRIPSILDWKPGCHPEPEGRIEQPKIFFFPDYTPTNHYQTGLYSAFEPEVEVAFGRIDHAVQASKQRSVIFHLHWPEPLFAGCKTAEDFSRAAALFWRLVTILKANGGLLFWTVHNALPHDRRFAGQMLEFHQRLAAEADLAHVHSYAAIGVLEELYEVEITNPVILPHGNYLDVYQNTVSEEQARTELGVPGDAFIFSFIGQIRPYKGIEALVEAFETIRTESSRPVHLLIAGKPVWPTPPGEWEARAEHLEDMTVVEGFIDDDDLQKFLNASDAVVLPYKDILTSGSAIMAAGFGRPVLLPELPTMAEIISHDLGPSFDPEEQGSLVNAMRKALAADPDGIARWRSNAAEFAKSADWGLISSKLKEHAPQAEMWENITVRGRPLRLRPGAPVKSGAIGVALLTHRSAEDASEAAALLPETVGGLPLNVFVLDNSEDDRELAKLRRLLPNAELLTADDNLGYAAGNNILLQRMRDVGCEFGLIINPDIRISSEALGVLLSEAVKGHIVSPLILNEAGAASFTGGSATIGDQVSIEQIQPEQDAPYAVDLLQGSAVMLPLTVLDDVGFMEESYFLYFEETDWFLSMKGKAELRVAPNAVAHHHKTSHGQAVPTLYYVYYFLRNALIFNKKHSGSYEAAKTHYANEFIGGWQKKIRRDAPSFIPIFDALSRIAFEDGEKGVVGRVDIQARLDDVLGLSGTPGGIEYIEPDAIGGSTLPSFGGKPRNIWVFTGDYPALVAKANEAGPKANFEDGRPRCDFHIELPLGVLLGASGPVTLRESETGARLPLSVELRKNVLCNDQLHSAHFSAAEAIRLRKPSYRASVNECVNGVLRGWISDQMYPERTVYFDVAINGVVIAGQPADKPHRDPTRGRSIYKNNGFEVRIPAHLLHGKKEIDVTIKPAGVGQHVCQRTITSQWRWGNYNPNFSGEAFLRWALLNRTTPEESYRDSENLHRYFATTLRHEQRLAASADHGLTSSIIMPVYNRERTVEAAIRSVIAQSYQGWQLIIADDGSQDQSVDIIKRLIAEHPEHDIQLIELIKNVGVSAARNRAMEAATGDVITYLDSDNTWKRDYLTIMLATLARNPERRSAYAGSEIWVRDPDASQAELTSIFVNPYSRSLLEARNFIDLNVFAHHRNLYEEKGGFCEDMKRLVDWHLILRYTKNAPPLFIPVLLAEYFIDPSANQITATVDYGPNYEKILEETDLAEEFVA